MGQESQELRFALGTGQQKSLVIYHLTFIIYHLPETPYRQATALQGGTRFQMMNDKCRMIYDQGFLLPRTEREPQLLRLLTHSRPRVQIVRKLHIRQCAAVFTGKC